MARSEGCAVPVHRCRIMPIICVFCGDLIGDGADRICADCAQKDAQGEFALGLEHMRQWCSVCGQKHGPDECPVRGAK